MPGFGTICQMPSFQWKIQNFWNLNVNYGNFIESPQFTLIGEKGMLEKFVLRLYPKGRTDANWVGLFLILVDGTKCSVSFKFSILDKYEKLFQVGKDYHRFFHKGYGFYGFSKFVEINKLKSHEEIVLPNGTLTILVELNSVKDKPKDPTMCLVDDLETLASNDEFTDIEIHCKDTMIKAHKAILVSRSSVFQAMFTNPCKENQTGIVNINDMEPEVLQDLITFMYSCKVKKLKENVADLFIAADMYMMESLKDMCTTYMMKNLTNENAISYLNLADGHNCKMLREAAMNYIVQNINDFMERPELKNVSQELVIEIMKKALNPTKN